MPKPDSVVEAIDFLASKGYVEDFRPCAEGLVESTTQASYDVSDVTVDYKFRIDGDSDPGDSAIVLGVSCGESRKGVVVSAYGPDADPETTELLVALAALR